MRAVYCMHIDFYITSRHLLTISVSFSFPPFISAVAEARHGPVVLQKSKSIFLFLVLDKNPRKGALRTFKKNPTQLDNRSTRTRQSRIHVSTHVCTRNIHIDAVLV